MSEKSDKRWLLAGALLLIIVIVGIVINQNHEIKDSTKFASTMDIDNGDQKINWNRYATTDVELTESYEITKPGIYHLTGEIEDGLITITLSKNEPVKLILDNVTIKNSTGPAILCNEADDLVIELIGDNYLRDGSEYDTKYNEDIKGAVYSKSDTTFEGEGTLNLVANQEDGIVSKDDLKFNSGTYIISAVDDAIRGKDSVYIINGEYELEVGADGIKSTNESDTGKGFVLIENGDFKIKSGAKGIKAINSIIIYDGTFAIDSYDDAIHTNNYIGISGGEYEITSGDDGVHANKELIVDKGKIVITKAYEGLEAQVITINGGEIDILATDDGMNAGGGADASANNRPGAGAFDADMNCILSINGGEIYINASGDGIDSNGYLYFNGGKVVVDGPTNNGNGAIDAGADVVMNGGEVIAIGASGMAKNLGQNSKIYNISVYLDTNYPKATEIEIKNATGETVLSHISTKTFNHIAAGSEKFSLGETYTIYLDDEKYEAFTISDIVTTIGNNRNGGGQNGQPMPPTQPTRR